jgi:hypothetical protein
MTGRIVELKSTSHLSVKFLGFYPDGIVWIPPQLVELKLPSNKSWMSPLTLPAASLSYYDQLLSDFYKMDEEDQVKLALCNPYKFSAVKSARAYRDNLYKKVSEERGKIFARKKNAIERPHDSLIRENNKAILNRK